MTMTHNEQHFIVCAKIQDGTVWITTDSQALRTRDAAVQWVTDDRIMRSKWPEAKPRRYELLTVEVVNQEVLP